ncbi:MAG: TIM barrel protein [Firmicutes bacterium]|nr:TIM barrel protein [Bacillota bacterium]
MKIGVQTYTIRKLAKKNLGFALDELLRVGVNKVELARLDLNDELSLLLSKKKIEVLSIQMTANKLLKDVEQISSFAKQVHCNLVIVSRLSIPAILGGKSSLLKFSKKLNQLVDLYHQKGIQVAFHHHDFEFKKIGNETKLEILLKNTLDELRIVSDTFWSKKSGYEPHEVIEMIGKRLIGIHLRDYMIQENGRSMDTEVGSGLIDFNQVMLVSNDASYAVIEQNTKHEIESIERSFNYLKSNYKEYFR